MTSLDLAALAARLPARPLTRFAPSPTGYLHLGHVANAIWVWGLARALGGRVLLRVEDHDRGRCRPEYERALLDDLDWLGLEPDLGAPDEFRAGPSAYRQSNAAPIYQAALDRLSQAGLVFGCDCTRKDIAGTEGDVFNEETRYPGRCRARGLALAPGIGARLRIDPEVERFVDARLGPQAQDPARQCGDLLLRDRLGQWTYQFAVVVDDLRHGVDLVVRGEDLLQSTGRQIHLGRLLGRPAPPVFLHHPLIRKDSGEKLSKAAGDTGIRELRAGGASRAAVLGRAAALTGLTPRAEPIEPRDLANLFSTGYDLDIHQRGGRPRRC
ncbi:MAG TPA: glutamate--tRNA ligase family protein [Gemmatimonadales bacterium]|nr:glutamate--tRNA ligase family protein [Gemmatimonadales bacterium]